MLFDAYLASLYAGEAIYYENDINTTIESAQDVSIVVVGVIDTKLNIV